MNDVGATRPKLANYRAVIPVSIVHSS